MKLPSRKLLVPISLLIFLSAISYVYIKIRHTAFIEQEENNTITISEHNRIAKEYIDILMKHDNPEEKRRIRIELASLQPPNETLRLVLTYYRDLKDSNTEEKTQLRSVISQINPSGHINYFKTIASETDDEPLFVNLVYSLRKAGDNEAKIALLKLINENYLGSTGQGLSSIYTSLLDITDIHDSILLADFVKKENPSDLQIQIIAGIAEANTSAEMLDLLRIIYLHPNSTETKLLIEKNIKEMELKMEQAKR